MDAMTSRTWKPTAPDAIGVPPFRMQRAMSTTPAPRPKRSSSSATSVHTVGTSNWSSPTLGVIRTVPPKMLGSGTDKVASVPMTSKAIRRCGESKLMRLCDTAPLANCAMALTCVGTLTGNSFPARGPVAIVRVLCPMEPTAATWENEPNRWTSVVR